MSEIHQSGGLDETSSAKNARFTVPRSQQRSYGGISSNGIDALPIESAAELGTSSNQDLACSKPNVRSLLYAYRHEWTRNRIILQSAQVVRGVAGRYHPIDRFWKR